MDVLNKIAAVLGVILAILEWTGKHKTSKFVVGLLWLSVALSLFN